MIALLLSGALLAAPSAGPLATSSAASLATTALDPASAAIAATLPAHLALVEARIPARIAEQAAAKDAQVVVEWRTPPRAGSSRVSITTRSARAWVPVVLAAQLERPTAARALPAGHVIAEDDLVMELAPGSRDPLAPALVVGATVRTALDAGDELTAEVLALAPPLPRGTTITVVAQLGALRVSRTGRLEVPARVGELARIRLDDTARLARARLDSPTTALLETSR